MALSDQAFIEILQKEVVLALGCTEPVAIALACAWAAKAAGGAPESITVHVDKNIYKNGLGVGVPGTGETGLYIAAAGGAIAGNPDFGLEVLRPITPDDVLRAKQLIADKKVTVEIQPDANEVYVDALVVSNGVEGRAAIRKRHNNIAAVSRNGQSFAGFPNEPAAQESAASKASSTPTALIQQADVQTIFSFCQNVPLEQIDFLRDAIATNKTFAEKAMEKPAIVGLGLKIQHLINRGLMSDDVLGKIKRVVVSAVEARMEGFNMAVMSCAGSGNQGLISTLPVVVAAEYVKASEEQTIRAAALSYLITVYTKSYMGVLTPVCGGNVAGGVGACCAITVLFGGTLPDIGRAIKNMAGSVMGVICDGAKIGCALKSMMAVSAAVDNALLALEGAVVPTGDGIVAESVDQTIQNMGFITTPGMSKTDDAIIQVMTRQRQ